MLNIIIHLFVVIPIFNVIKSLKAPHFTKFVLASIVFSTVMYAQYLEFTKTCKLIVHFTNISD